MGYLRYGLAAAVLALLPAASIQGSHGAIRVLEFPPDATIRADIQACQAPRTAAPANQQDRSVCFVTRLARRYRQRDLASRSN